METDKTNQSIGLGDAAAEIIEAAKNLTTQERIKIANIFRQLQKARSAEAKKVEQLEAQVHRVADAYDAQTQKHEVVTVAAKRSVKQFLKSIGWLD
jgi:hypothetical protein